MPMSLSMHLLSCFPPPRRLAGPIPPHCARAPSRTGQRVVLEWALGVGLSEQPHLPLACHRLSQDAVRLLAGQRIDGPHTILLGGVHPAMERHRLGVIPRFAAGLVIATQQIPDDEVARLVSVLLKAALDVADDGALEVVELRA